ncbi:MAG: cytochrome C oxidase subunit I [Bacteroidetes bacterium]|nr:cytochrome C oxidase subunit I [Bacteroidota bacterium]
MFPGAGLQQTTSHKVVLPFYYYATVSFLIACVLLLLNTGIAQEHYFQPQTLAITHLMALGWATMIILGASHQLLPVLIEGQLSSNGLGYASFLFSALGIPSLVFGFYSFELGTIFQVGAILVNLGMLAYLINVLVSIYESKRIEIHAWFMAAASLWLFSTTFLGLLLAFNFTKSILPADSLHYLPVHAHMGLVGWFLLLVMGVASRLVPLFLISKYTNDKLLWSIFILVNAGLIGFLVLRACAVNPSLYYTPFTLVLVAVGFFIRFCFAARKARIRKSVDPQMKLSLLSVIMLLLPLLALVIVLAFLSKSTDAKIILLYGFTIFFGWLTAIILAMTFKTLPFIVWNKVYQNRAVGKTPIPKDLFSERLFDTMAYCYLGGFILFVAGIIATNDLVLKSGAGLLLLAAILYAANVGNIIFHRPKKS